MTIKEWKIASLSFWVKCQRGRINFEVLNVLWDFSLEGVNRNNGKPVKEVQNGADVFMLAGSCEKILDYL